MNKQNISHNTFSVYNYDPHLRQTFRSVNPGDVVFPRTCTREEILSKVEKSECLPQTMVAIALFCLSNPYRFWKIKNNNNTSGADTSRFLIWRHPKKKKLAIRVITKLPNPEQSYKGKVKTHNYINRQNQSTTGKLWKS